MRFEEKLELGIVAEEAANAESPADMRPNQRAIFDAITKLIDMDIEAVYDFATSGGYIEEGIVVINGLPSTLLTEQVVSRTVHTGNYSRILEVVIDRVQPQYKFYIIVNLNVSDERINEKLEKIMANWQPDQPIPMVAYRSEESALKAMGDVEDAAAARAANPVKPSTKSKSATPTDVKQVAVHMATRMGKKEFIPAIQKLSPHDLLEMAKQGRAQSQVNKWVLAKYIFLGWLALSTLVTGLSGLAALIIGYFVIKHLEKANIK